MRPGSWTAAALGVLLGCAGEATPTGDAAAHDAADVAINDLGGMDAGLDSGVPRCVPGMSVACACVGGVSGAQVCNSAGAYEACQCGDGGMAPADAPVVYVPIGGPRLILPRSVSRSMTQRPTFRWVPPEGVRRARVTVARNRALTMGVRSGEAEGTSWRPTEPLPFGVWFWRVEGLGGDGGVVWTSPTWEFRAPRRDSAVDSSWGKFRDFNGDGYDDLVVIRNPSVDIYMGSATGIATTATLTLTAPAFENPDRFWYTWNMVWGDINGDGLTDLAYGLSLGDRTGSLERPESRIAIHWGGASGLAAFPNLLLDEYGSSPGLIYHGLSIGDWDGDGLDDLLPYIGVFSLAPSSPPASVFLHRGSAEGEMIARRGEPILGDFAGSRLRGVSLIDDLDIDGRPDLVGEFRRDGGVESRFVLRGFDPLKPLSLPSPPAARPPMSFEADLDGDGHLEYIQHPPESVSISRTRGLPEGPTEAWLTITAPEIPSSVTPDSSFGSRLAFGDVSGDGYGDLIVGSPGAPPAAAFYNGPGRVYLFAGSPTAITESRRWRGLTETNERFGSDIHAGDDLNGDGFDELVVAAIGQSRLEVYQGAADPSGMTLVFRQRVSNINLP